MKPKRFILISYALFLGCGLKAQNDSAWSLKNCIEYAIKNNIDLQKSRIAEKESEVDLTSAKATLFPSLSFSSNQNITNRPYSCLLYTSPSP